MFVLTMISIVLIGYVGICTFLYLNQEAFIFHPTRLDPNYTHTFDGPFEETNLAVPGARINVVHFLTDNPKGVVLYVHGNGDIIPSLKGIASYFLSLEYNVIIPDYRGYGKSTGQITNEAELQADMEVVYQYVLDLYDEGSITIYGQSLGTGLSTFLAASHSPKQLILESPYFSMVSLIRTHLPFIPGFICKYPLHSDQVIGQVEAPIYVIHGGRDRLIPFDHGERLYALIESEKQFLHLPDAGHGPLLGDVRLRRFLEEIF